jgi:hypothetical protein
VPALASLADVKRIMRLDDVNAARDDKINAALRAIEAWAALRLKGLADAGPQAETFFDIYEDATLPLPARDAVVTKLKVYDYPSSQGIPLSPIELGLGHGYDITDSEVILRPVLGVSPFEGAQASRRTRCYSRVEVFYIATGVVPADVTEGIAFMAAGYYQFGPTILQAIRSERIGDYSYTVDVNQDPNTGMPFYVSQALFFLTPHMRKSRVSVT